MNEWDYFLATDFPERESKCFERSSGDKDTRKDAANQTLKKEMIERIFFVTIFITDLAFGIAVNPGYNVYVITILRDKWNTIA